MCPKGALSQILAKFRMPGDWPSQIERSKLINERIKSVSTANAGEGVDGQN